MVAESPQDKTTMSNQRYRRMEDLDAGDPPLPLWRKLCFAMGGVPYQMTTTVIGFFLSIFLLEVAQLRPGYVAIVLFSGKAWDAVTDPTCGFLVSRTRTRWGRMRPWILFTAPFACVAYFFLFYVPGKYPDEVAPGQKPETDVSMEAKLGYYLAMFWLFEGLLSGLHVPYTSMTMLVTTKQKERDSITAYRMVFEAMGVLTGVVLQGQLVADSRCDGETDIATTQTVASMEKQEESYRTGSFIVVGLYMLCAFTVFLGVKEKEPDESSARETSGFWAGLKLVFGYGPYMKAAMTFLFLSLAVGVVQGNIALYVTHSLKMGDKFSLFVLILLSVSILSMPVWQFILGRFGKKRAYAAGMMILIPTFSSLMYLPEKSGVVFYVIIVFSGFGISVALLLPWSVLPDVLDLFMLERKQRQDALFYAFYVFFNKFAIGIGLGLSQLALSIGGYEVGQCKQPSSVGETLRLLVTPGPVVCVLIALIFLWLYPIDEAKRVQIRKDILLHEEKTRPQPDVVPVTMSYESITVHPPAPQPDSTQF